MASQKLPPGSILSYLVSVPAAVVLAAVYILLGCGLVFRSVHSHRKADWGLCIGIGALCQGIGFVVRVAYHYHQASIPLYAIQQLVIVVSPAAYFAFNYILFGRLVDVLARDQMLMATTTRSLCLIKAHHMGLFFVTSDVVTFLLQMAGGGMEAVPGTISNVGNKIFLVGIVAQFASYVVYLLLVVRMRLFVVPRLRTTSSIGTQADKILLLIAWSSVWIIVRCIFRTVELAEGFTGVLYTTEVYFYLLDALPLVLSIAVYLIWWPSQIVNLERQGKIHTSFHREDLSYRTTQLSQEKAQT